MKKMMIVAALFTFAALPSFSQVGLGIKGGLNFANLDIEGADSRTGFHFGAFADIPLAENLAIQPEVLWSTQGAKLDNTEVNTNYINVPILLRLTVAEFLNIHAGPQFGFITKAEQGDTDIKENIKNSDFSIAMGAGVNLPLGLEAGVRYNLGVSDISEDGVDFDNDKVKNRVFQIYAAWRLLGHK